MLAGEWKTYVLINQNSVDIVIIGNDIVNNTNIARIQLNNSSLMKFTVLNNNVVLLEIKLKNES